MEKQQLDLKEVLTIIGDKEMQIYFLKKTIASLEERLKTYETGDSAGDSRRQG